jgi:site-specific DNA-methyltransferase (adenine-specific)
MGNIELLNCDCMEYMKNIPDKYFDLAIVDPPYGIDWTTQVENPNKGKNWNVWDNKEWDKKIPDKNYFDELFRISKDQIIWGGNYMIENLYSTSCWVIWDKMQEFCGATFEMGWTSFTSPAKAFRFSRVEAYANQTKIHPTQKPVKLYKWLLKNYASPDFKIIDTHLGSGSSAIAAYDFGCDFVGCEIDKDYYDAAVKRFEIHKMQQKLF